MAKLSALFVFVLALLLLLAFQGWAQAPPANQAELVAKAQHGKQLMTEGKFVAAIAVYQDLVKALPGNPGLVLNLALAQHMAGREREAIPNFELVLKSQPSALPALLSLGAARLAVNEPSKAIAPLERALQIDPANIDARGMLATALMDSKRYLESAAQYRTLTEKAPGDSRAWYGLGMSYQALATEAFEMMQKADPKSAWVLALVADSRVQRRQFRSAFFFYSETLKELPNLHGVHAAMAEIYRRTGHPEWAGQEDAKERQLPPADCAAHSLECRFIGGKDLDILNTKLPPKPALENLYWRAKAANELAMQAFFQLGQMPESLELHQLRAEIARNGGQPLQAVEEWRAALKLVPGDFKVRQELATCLFLSSDYKAAHAEAAELLAAMPGNAELNFIAGDSLVRLEEADKAEKYLRAALALDPKMTAAAASLGLALARLGRQAEAVPLLERSIELDDDGSLHYQLARAYQASGQPDKAKAAMAQYQELLDRNQKAKDEVAREAQIGPPK